VSDASVIDASKSCIVALFSNDLHSLDNFVAVKHSGQGEQRELLREIVRRYVDQAIVRLFLGRWVGRKSKIAHDQIVVLISHVLIKYDFVHTLSKVEVYFRQECGCI